MRIFRQSIKSTRLAIVLFLMVCTLSVVAVEYSFTGFGSIVLGRVTSGDGYIANYNDLSIYGKSGSVGTDTAGGLGLNQESRFGVQGVVSLSDSTQITAQWISRGNNRYVPKVEWLFVGQQLSNDVNLQVGKLRLPVYLYSDKMDVGFSYPWLRVPADTYSLDAVSFVGAKLNYDFAVGDFSERLAIFAGTEKDKNSKLMSYLFNTPIDRRHRLAGVVADTGYGPFQLRLSYTKDQMQQRTSDPANAFRNENFNGEFIDVAFQYQSDDLTLIAEWNKNRPFYQSWLVSGIYQFGSNSLYLTRSGFKLDQPWEKHKTISMGFRRDIGSNMDVKLDITHMVDQGRNPVTGEPNPVIKLRPGHATVASVSFDFIF